MDRSTFVAISQALAHEQRNKMVELLSCGSLCACELLPYFSFSQPTLSAHIKVLRQAGIVHEERDGKKRIYSLNEALLNDFLLFAARLFRGGEDCLCRRTAVSGD